MLFLRSAFRPHPPRSVSHRLVPLALGLVLGAALVGCGPEDEPPPRALLGEWKTDAKSHADRGFTIDEHWLRFGTGDYSNANYRVERFETLPERSGRKLVRVHYREPDGSISTLDLSLESGATPRLRFVTREDVVWTPRGTAKSAAAGDAAGQAGGNATTTPGPGEVTTAEPDRVAKVAPGLDDLIGGELARRPEPPAAPQGEGDD
ncbi:MAG: hypothetical protein R3F16_21035 [Myxococcota bacterium]|nr:hypothetical protein [Myxococcales bacterium]